MSRKRDLYNDAQTGYQNIRIAGNNDTTLFIIAIDDKRQTTEGRIFSISKENFQYQIKYIEEVNNEEVIIDDISFSLSFEEDSNFTHTALFSFSWNRNFKGFICIEINNQYLI